ncbi:anti-sigma-F factor Fin family protein [Falsibacillus pallidus]|uniref:Uncharacterized protein DUF2757 n=1 Tax=Falsibacillus pallidus TaxID=493781 RepID=A0A370G3T8_9BACI|nr:anti-sigma-F factor Fin family protein [Falsibacillus pallidus]RDI38412.1 uncharacterized protein DUF2757 [Falsibacillus pallidus]
MAIHYLCRHCGTQIGSLDKFSVHTEQLGLHKLSDQERQEMVSYESNGDIQITSICEDCQEALDRSPALHEFDYLIH